jgi:hypothetical protein
MARRIGHGDEAAGQLCLWSEESLPSPFHGEGQDGGAARSRSRPLRAVAAARKDTIARSERALAAIRSILASDSREEAARHAAAFRRNR